MIPESTQTLVLNLSGEPLSVVSWKRGLSLVLEGHASQVCRYEAHRARDGRGRSFEVPAVVALRRYVRRDYLKPPYCRKNVLLRDGSSCQYCGRRLPASALTLDHVIPRSRWKQKTTPTCWENIVAACHACNGRKADRTCEEAGMHPRVRPRPPGAGVVLVGLDPHRTRTPDEWKPYLKAFQGASSHEEASEPAGS